MIVTGAGGHALEVLDVLIAKNQTDDLYFFDEFKSDKLFQGKFPIIHSQLEVEKVFLTDPSFILGTGKPAVRFQFYEQLVKLGGRLSGLIGHGVVQSKFSSKDQSDIFNLCFISSNTQLGKGSLINTGAQIHHEVTIGEFTEVNPGAVILGNVTIGNFCSIGANATILPNVRIGDHVVVGAGAVITKDVRDGVTVVGVPGRILLGA